MEKKYYDAPSIKVRKVLLKSVMLAGSYSSVGYGGSNANGNISTIAEGKGSHGFDEDDDEDEE